MTNAETLATLPLRQRKFASTKLALLDAALTGISNRPLSDIPVRELCDAVSISEAGFFNYFPRKTDLLVYYVQLWSIEMGWHARRLAGRGGSGLAAIEQIFILTARQMRDRPGVMAEIIAGQLRMTEPPRLEEISLAERLAAFPNLDGVGHVPATGLDQLLPPFIRQAMADGDIPAQLNRRAIMDSLAAIFFGVPVVHRMGSPAAIEKAYRNQLALLWEGFRSRHARTAR
jgi:AcrR family transcriptional regulator